MGKRRGRRKKSRDAGREKVPNKEEEKTLEKKAEKKVAPFEIPKFVEKYAGKAFVEGLASIAKELEDFESLVTESQMSIAEVVEYLGLIDFFVRYTEYIDFATFLYEIKSEERVVEMTVRESYPLGQAYTKTIRAISETARVAEQAGRPILKTVLEDVVNLYMTSAANLLQRDIPRSIHREAMEKAAEDGVSIDEEATDDEVEQAFFGEEGIEGSKKTTEVGAIAAAEDIMALPRNKHFSVRADAVLGWRIKRGLDGIPPAVFADTFLRRMDKLGLGTFEEDEVDRINDEADTYAELLHETRIQQGRYELEPSRILQKIKKCWIEKKGDADSLLFGTVFIQWTPPVLSSSSRDFVEREKKNFMEDHGYSRASGYTSDSPAPLQGGGMAVGNQQMVGASRHGGSLVKTQQQTVSFDISYFTGDLSPAGFKIYTLESYADDYRIASLDSGVFYEVRRRILAEIVRGIENGDIPIVPDQLDIQDLEKESRRDDEKKIEKITQAIEQMEDVQPTSKMDEPSEEEVSVDTQDPESEEQGAQEEIGEVVVEKERSKKGRMSRNIPRTAALSILQTKFDVRAVQGSKHLKLVREVDGKNRTIPMPNQHSSGANRNFTYVLRRILKILDVDWVDFEKELS